MSKEIDFDELDKAVTSLMGTVSSTDKEEERKENTYTVSSTLKPGEKPPYDRLEEVAKKIGSETLLTDSERGVVNDLDGGSTPDSHDADGVKTVELSTTEKLVVSEPRAPEPLQAPKASRPAGGRFMDVVHPSSDMRTTNGELPVVTPRTEPGAIPVPARPKSIQAVPQANTASAEPLTPFLPDAKVEKRPLGGAVASTDAIEEDKADITPTPSEPSVTDAKPKADEPETDSESTPVNQHDAQTVLDASAFEQPTPEEALAVSAIEANETVSPEIISLQSIESSDTESLKAPVTSDKEGTIYDVENQSHPLTHPAKQKSGWGTVLIILLVIVFAAALGAAAYFILGLGV